MATAYFQSGNIKPLNITVGKNIPISEMNIAVCCESVTVEINKPNDKTGKDKQNTFTN